MNKKGQGISINTIIIAAIALAVLVVLFAIFTGRLGSFSKGVQDTDTCAQKCTSLNKQKATEQPRQDAPAGTSPCRQGEQYVSGRYSDAQFGCCCS